MNKYNKIDWKTGMEITPQVLIDADNFHIEQQNLIRRLQVMPCYGLLPESAYNQEDAPKQFITPTGELEDFNEQCQYTGDIPPCMAINSHQELENRFEHIKQQVKTIVTQIKESGGYNAMFFPFSLLELELKNYSTFETPAELFLIIKKTVFIAKFNIKEPMEKTETLLDKTYCHTKIDEMIRLLQDSLCEIEEKTKVVEAPIIEEKTEEEFYIPIY